MMLGEVLRVEDGTVRAILAALRRNRVVVVVREVKDAAMRSPRDGRRRSDHVLVDVGKGKGIEIGTVCLRVQVLNQDGVVVGQIVFHVDHVHLVARRELLLQIRIIRS